MEPTNVVVESSDVESAKELTLVAQSVRRRLLVVGVVGFAVVVLGCLLNGPSSAELRLDSGDLRYCAFGIPYSYEAMPEPLRSVIVGAAREAGIREGEWVCCARYPLPTTNNPDAMCRGFYAKTAAWLQAERPLGVLILKDVAEYIRKTKASHSLPASERLLWYARFDGTRTSIDKEAMAGEPEFVRYAIDRLGAYQPLPDGPLAFLRKNE